MKEKFGQLQNCKRVDKRHISLLYCHVNMVKQKKLPLKQRIVRGIIVIAFYLVRSFFGLLPLRIGLAFSGFLGRLCFHLLPHERRTALKGLRSAFPGKSDEEIRSTAKESFINLGMNFYEILSMRRIRRIFDDYVTIEGEECLREAVKGQGCVYITGHVGNWELMAFYLAYRGYKITPIAKELYDTRLNEILLKLRSENGVHTILRDKPYTSRSIIKALRGKGVLGMLIDQDTKLQGIFVDFFGKKAYTTIGAASLALKFKSAVVAGFIHRQKGGGHELVITPVELTDTGDKKLDIYENTLRYSKAVEDAVREYPAQWVWMHRRWKTQPKSSTKTVRDEKV